MKKVKILDSRAIALFRKQYPWTEGGPNLRKASKATIRGFLNSIVLIDEDKATLSSLGELMEDYCHELADPMELKKLQKLGLKTLTTILRNVISMEYCFRGVDELNSKQAKLLVNHNAIGIELGHVKFFDHKVLKSLSNFCMCIDNKGITFGRQVG